MLNAYIEQVIAVPAAHRELLNRYIGDLPAASESAPTLDVMMSLADKFELYDWTSFDAATKFALLIMIASDLTQAKQSAKREAGAVLRRAINRRLEAVG